MLENSLNVLAGARELASLCAGNACEADPTMEEGRAPNTSDPLLHDGAKPQVVFVMVTGESDQEQREKHPKLQVSVDDVATDAMGHGADRILMVTVDMGQNEKSKDSHGMPEENASENGSVVPHMMPGVTAQILADLVQKREPTTVLFPLNGLMREIAARSAFRCHAGLIADCLKFKYKNDEVIAVCPSHGGEMLAELGFSDPSKTGFITVQPNAFKRINLQSDLLDSIEKIRIPLQDLKSVSKRVKPISRKRKSHTCQTLETAEKVVAGGAGLGNIEGFRNLRKLAAALGAQIGATRPPILWHWTDESNLIGQTGKNIQPELLLSVGTSGAVQYTAGITEAKTVVAVNRDPGAPIFQLADIGVVEDAAGFIPLLTDKIHHATMRSLANALDQNGSITKDGAGAVGGQGSDFGSKLMEMRHAHDITADDLAKRTGRTPEFIEALENNTTTPSVGFMIQLAEVFGVDSGTFLNDDAQAALSDNRAKEYTRRTSNYHYQTLTPGAENEHLRVFMITIESNKKHKPVAYRHEGEEFVFVMDGTLELTLDGKPHKLMAGESMKFNSQTSHQLKSIGSMDTKCLVTLYTP